MLHRIAGDTFDLPTTLARRGCRLHVVNSPSAGERTALLHTTCLTAVQENSPAPPIEGA